LTVHYAYEVVESVNLKQKCVQRYGTYDLLVSVRQRSDGRWLVLAGEGDGELLASVSEDAVVDDVVSWSWLRHFLFSEWFVFAEWVE